VRTAPFVQDSAASRLTTEKNVMGNVKVRAEVELLMDEGDSSGAGLPGAGEADRSSLKSDGALIGGDDASENLHQRALARSVFAHQNVNFPFAQIEGNGVQDLHVGIGDRPTGTVVDVLRDPLHLQERFAHLLFPSNAKRYTKLPGF